jgi:predicted neuraminidase
MTPTSATPQTVQIPSRRAGLWICGLLALAFIAATAKIISRPPNASFQVPTTAATGTGTGVAGMQTRFVSSVSGPHRHAGSLVELADGRLRAFWFSGSREGAADVEIRSAVFDPAQSRWTDEASIVDRAATQSGVQRFIRKLGNPVAVRVADGRLHLFYVTVSVGGWAGSSISMITSTDEGKTWGPARRLVTSPFINISTLVKGTPFLYADGSIGLPVYHEFLGKFGELLRLDASGNIITKQRLSHGISTLQPVVLVRSPTQARVLMRAAGAISQNKVIGTATNDAGLHWDAVDKTMLSNPSAAVAGVALPEGPLLAVINNLDSNRDALSLVASTDGGRQWRTLFALEDQLRTGGGELDEAQFSANTEKLARATDANLQDLAGLVRAAQQHQCEQQRCNFEFSYPYLIRTANGDLQLVYTWNRSAIKHVSFSREWIDARIKAAGAPQ